MEELLYFIASLLFIIISHQGVIHYRLHQGEVRFDTHLKIMKVFNQRLKIFNHRITDIEKKLKSCGIVLLEDQEDQA